MMMGPLNASTTLGDAYGSARPTVGSLDDAATGGDLNGDGQLDVAAFASVSTNVIYIYLDLPQGHLELTGHSTYYVQPVYSPYAPGANGVNIAHDFDGDGMQDLLLARPIDYTYLREAGMVHILAGTTE